MPAIGKPTLRRQPRDFNEPEVPAVELIDRGSEIAHTGRVDQTAAAVVIDERAGAGHQVAGMDGAIRREINNRIAVGVAAAEISGSHFFSADEDGCFFRECDACRSHVWRSIGLLVFEDILARICS